LIKHPSYSPDLALFDYYLFPNFKKLLARKRFTSNNKAIAAVNRYFADLSESHFNDWIEFLKNVRINVLKFQEIILENKTYFTLKTFLSMLGRELFTLPTYHKIKLVTQLVISANLSTRKSVAVCQQIY